MAAKAKSKSKPAPKAKAKPAAKKPAPKAKAKPAAKKPAPKAKAKPAAKKPAPKAKAKPAAKKPAPKAKAKPIAKKTTPKAKPAAKKPAPKEKAKSVAKKTAPKVKTKPVAKKELAKPTKADASLKKSGKKQAITSGKSLKKENKKLIDDKLDLDIPVDEISVKAVFGDDVPDDIDEDDDTIIPVSATPKPSRRSRRKPPKIAPVSPGPQTITPAKPKPLIEKKNIPQPAYTPEVKPFIKKGTGKVDNRNRYSDEELNEFKKLIEGKLQAAKNDYESLKSTLSYKDHHGTDDTYATFKMMEDGSETLSREEVAQLAIRQEKFIQNLEHALVRIQNKTYGICRVTGKLIPKERLRAVPHATLSIEAKEQMNR